MATTVQQMVCHIVLPLIVASNGLIVSSKTKAPLWIDSPENLCICN